MNWFQATNYWLSGHDFTYALWGFCVLVSGGIQGTIDFGHTPHLMGFIFIMFSLFTAWWNRRVVLKQDLSIYENSQCIGTWSHGSQAFLTLGFTISAGLTALDGWNYANMMDLFMILTLVDCVLCRLPIHLVMWCKVFTYRRPIPAPMTELSHIDSH